MHDYLIRDVPTMDLYAALICEGERAQREGFKGVAERQFKLAKHVRNAERQMRDIVPSGYRLEVDLTFRFVPDINPVLSDDAYDRRKRESK